MKKTPKKTNMLHYLYASGRIHAMENSLLNAERRTRMIEAQSAADAYRVVGECGYDLSGIDTARTGVEGMYLFARLMHRARAELYDFAERISESRALTDFFRVKTDCHNIKTILKSQCIGADAAPLLLEGGIYSVAELTERLGSGKAGALAGVFGAAADEAREILSRTSDGQLADFVVDRAMLDEQARFAGESEIEFLQKYVRLVAESANLRSTIRLLRMQNGVQLLETALSDKGLVEKGRLISAARENQLAELYQDTAFAGAAALGVALNDEKKPLTEFERACAAAENRLFEPVRYVAAGPEILIAYIVNKEEEFKILRTIMAGKLTNQSPADIAAALGSV